MTFFYYRTAVIFLLHCLTTGFANENSTLLPGNNTGIGCNVNIPALNRTNISLVCRNLEVDKSQIEEVLRLMHFPTTNTVQLKVSVVARNGCRNFPEMTWPWASELGRTIISLVARAKETVFTSPIFTTVLSVGTEEANIQVIEEPYGSLPSGNKGWDKIFDCLLRQLSQIEHLRNAEDTNLYKLCRELENGYSYTTYNCCRMIGDRNLTICRDYSSAVVKYALPTVIAVFLASFFLVLPPLLQHIIILESTKFYKISESHVSLISIVSMLCFEGHGQARCFFRRAFFTGLSVLVFLPDFFGHTWLMWVFIAWAFCFVFVDDVEDLLDIGTDKQDKKERVEPLDEKMVSRLTEPFSYLCKKYNEKVNCVSETFEWIEKCFLINNILFLIMFCVISSVALVLLTVWVVVNFLKFTVVDVLVSLVVPHKFSMIKERFGKKSVLFKFLIVVAFIIRLITSAMIVFFTGMIFVLALSCFVGFCLNGEFFNPFIAPILTIIIYSWRSWKFSVEVKCLQLKTLILEVCKEKATKADSTNDDDGHSSKPSKWLKCISKKESDKKKEASAENDNKRDGEAIISKALYQEISAKIMPFSLLLFYFFRRVIFVVVYAFAMFTTMLLVRESGISGSLQALSAIVAALIPFVFDTIWAEHMILRKRPLQTRP